MEERQKLARAKEQVAKITGFYVHLGTFVLVMTALFFANLLLSPTWWVQWPFLAWGVCLLAHGMCTFGRTPRLLTNWQQRKIKEIKDKM